ncbi:12552_t:CDS:1 [Funneliformis mosseae]|uniref:12552_t:CDS:1 n=1 Tax=Funneliformis mosseae TaxID=27381 RepID=A0A9N8YNP0_FUNMO|nr:12552_t:CDS:1 [Funneliformis mosseae]
MSKSTTQTFTTQPSSKSKSTIKRFSDIRRRFPTFPFRNTKIIMKSDLEKISYKKYNNSSVFLVSENQVKHQISFSDSHDESYNKNKLEELDFFDEFEEIIQPYVPIFTRNKNQMIKNHSDYEEPTNEIIKKKRRLTFKLVVKKFTRIGQYKEKSDKEYQDGKTNPFE